jgi:GntR family transcriptional regulator
MSAPVLDPGAVTWSTKPEVASMRQPWELVADALRHAIANSTYKPGDQLPSENQLAAQHGASRQTVRRALRELRLRGLITSHQGKGAFVRAPAAVSITLTAANYDRHQRERQSGFNAQVREQGRTPRQELIGVGTVPAPPETAERLGLEEGDDVLVRHLRFVVDDQPVQIVKVYYDVALAAGSKLGEPSLIAGGVHGELNRLGVRVTRFVEELRGARLPRPEEERELRLPDGVPVLRSIRTAYADERPVEVMDTVSHGEVVSFRFEIAL